MAPVAATRLTEDILPPDLFERLKPEFVSPLVLYLCSEQCRETGLVFNAGLGFFNQAAIVTGPGILIGDGRTLPTPEDIAHHWKAIHSLEGGKEYFNTTQAFGDMLLGGGSQPEAALAAAPEGPTVQSVFDGLPQAFRAEKAAGVDVVFQFRISGPGGGDWFAAIKDGRLHGRAGDSTKNPRPPSRWPTGTS